MKLRRLPLLLSLALVLPTAHAAQFSAQELEAARALQSRVITLDSHLDTPANFSRPDFDVTHNYTGNGLSQVDLPRMREGLLDGGFWVIYTGQSDRSPEKIQADRDYGLIRMLDIHKTVAAHADQFEIARTAADAARIKAAGKRVVYISMENASPLEHDPSLLSYYYKTGLRMLSVTHTADNGFGDSGTGKHEWKGLSATGAKLVDEAVRLGIVLDQSHASDEVFDALVERLPVPFVLSHTSAKALYDHPRNIDDARLRKLAAAGGVIQVNAYGGYLVETKASDERKAAEKALEESLGGWRGMTMASGEALTKGYAEIDAKYPVRKATEDDYFAHLEHILKVVGPKHVGIGMDWDGGGGVVGQEDITTLPRVTAWLMRKGYSEAQIADIWGGNLLRVLAQVEAHAAKQAAAK
jgi:membrane dipeptidase